jgi:GNAT superfamily N-acetyltransferase
MTNPLQTVRVRAGTRDDFPAILALLRGLHAETPHAPLCADRLGEGVAECLQEGLVILSLDSGGRPVGTVGLVVQSPWFSAESWLSDLWMYVHPQHRRTPHARTLLAACARVAAERCMPLQMTVSGYGPRIAGKIRLFSRVLGEPTGAIWHKVPAHG